MKSYTDTIILAIVACVYMSCEGKFEPKENLGPQAVELQFPEDDEICQEGSPLGNGQIAVPFRWDAVAEATAYRLQVNGQEPDDSQKIDIAITEDDLVAVEVALEPGTLYTWFVYTIKDKLETKSPERSFYSSTVPNFSYTPFPATITVSDNGAGNATISWESTDLDDDIVGYDIYLSTENPPVLSLENTTTTSLQDDFSEGVTYYVAVVTKDATGNSSVGRTHFIL